mmetsp:Transcript_31506/g.100385  ORF Transcript_31506/g.100385 Transcript_31506/m.100385 type:complete len:248 (+) Transcript_31506:50-793(+)
MLDQGLVTSRAPNILCADATVFVGQLGLVVVLHEQSSSPQGLTFCICEGRSRLTAQIQAQARLGDPLPILAFPADHANHVCLQQQEAQPAGGRGPGATADGDEDAGCGDEADAAQRPRGRCCIQGAAGAAGVCAGRHGRGEGGGRAARCGPGCCHDAQGHRCRPSESSRCRGGSTCGGFRCRGPCGGGQGQGRRGRCPACIAGCSGAQGRRGRARGAREDWRRDLHGGTSASGCRRAGRCSAAGGLL